MKRTVPVMLTVFLIMLIFCAAASAQDVTYTVRLDAAVGIHQAPDLHSAVLQPVGEDGVYTIVEEAQDGYGRLWGQLKSGAGWVLLNPFRRLPYTVSLSAEDSVHTGPGDEFRLARTVGEDGVYTIVEEGCDSSGRLWGRLKSGAGWVRIRDAVSSAGYTVRLGAWTPVYSLPGRGEGVCTGIVGEDGVYTITGEMTDFEGNLWGGLKSGAGWINLTDALAAEKPPLNACFADILPEELQTDPEYIPENAEYAVRIAFRANERLENVELTSLRFEEDSFTAQRRLFSMELLQEGSFFTAELVFCGDMSAYGVTFEGADGELRQYALFLSGLDGAPELTEY